MLCIPKGAPLLLSPNDHNTLLDILLAKRNSRGKINPSIVIRVAKGNLNQAGRSSEMKSNGGALKLSKDWARKILSYHLQWTVRKATTDRKLTLEQVRQAVVSYMALETHIILP